MRFLKENKVAIGVLCFIGLAIYVYFTYFRASPEPLLTSSEQTPVLSPEVLTLLTSLNSIQPNGAIFTDPVFLSLSDFGVQIPPQNVGKHNPFAPINVPASR